MIAMNTERMTTKLAVVLRQQNVAPQTIKKIALVLAEDVPGFGQVDFCRLALSDVWGPAGKVLASLDLPEPSDSLKHQPAFIVDDTLGPVIACSCGEKPKKRVQRASMQHTWHQTHRRRLNLPPVQYVGDWDSAAVEAWHLRRMAERSEI